LASSGLQVMNSSLDTFPVYVLQRNKSSVAGGSSQIKIAYLMLDFPLHQPVQEADLLTMFSEILRRPKTAIHLLPERGPYTAARNFFDRSYDLVAIYEDPPSALLQEFQINLTEELHAEPSEPLQFAAGATEVRQVVPNRFGYILQAPRGSDDQSLGIIQIWRGELPLILSNLKGQDADTLSAALSYAY